jgi:hypothetical protein
VLEKNKSKNGLVLLILIFVLLMVKKKFTSCLLLIRLFNQNKVSSF